VDEGKKRQKQSEELVEQVRGLVDVDKALPERTCFICRRKANKKMLCRMVRGTEGTVSLDVTGTKPGRGAYLCLSSKCLDLALIKTSLERALRTTIGRENKELLVAQIRENRMRFKEIE